MKEKEKRRKEERKQGRRKRRRELSESTRSFLFPKWKLLKILHLTFH